MTSRQRVITALSQPAATLDRTPCFEYVLLSPLADRLLGRPYAGDWDIRKAMFAARGYEQALRQEAIDLLDLAQLLGHDMLYVTPSPPPPALAPPAQPEPEPFADDPVRLIEWRTAQTAAKSAQPPDYSLRIYQLVQQEMRHRGLDLPIMAPAYRHGVWTNTELMETMVVAPEVAHEHFRQCTRFSMASAQAYLALGIDIIGVGGDFAGNRPLISPEAYRQFMVPEIRKVSDVVRAAGKWTVNASDGDLWSVIEDFLVGCGVNGYLEIDQGAGMDLPRLKAGYGERFAFVGNMDCGRLLSCGTPAQVAAETAACLKAGGSRGHIFCASNAITSAVSLENYMAMVNAYRHFVGLQPLRIV